MKREKKLETRIAVLEDVLANLMSHAASMVDYEKVGRQKWLPIGTRQSLAGNLEQAMNRATNVLHHGRTNRTH